MVLENGPTRTSRPGGTPIHPGMVQEISRRQRVHVGTLRHLIVCSHNLDYTALMPRRAVKLGPDAVRQFKALSAAERARLTAAMEAALGEDDATAETTTASACAGPPGSPNSSSGTARCASSIASMMKRCSSTLSGASAATSFSSAARE